MNRREYTPDDRGMTLVEVMLAMVILAIIVVPLSHAFVSAARVNQDARRRLRITTAAQDLMEGMVANNLEELAYSVYYPEIITESITGKPVNEGFDVIKRSLVTGAMNEVRCTSIASNGAVTGLSNTNPASADEDDHPCIVSTDAGVTYDFVKKQNNGKYYFALQNVTMENDNPNLRADVLIEVDASAYREGSSSVSGNSALHNNTPIVDINGMDNTKDFIFQEDVAMMLSDLNASYYTSYNLTDMVTKIDVTLSKINDGGVDRPKLHYHCRLEAKNNSAHYIEDVQDYTGLSEVRNIYLFYYPTYNAASGGSAVPDEIEFTNDGLYNNHLYILKQENDTYSGFIDSYEQNYKCDVSINENDPGGKVLTSIRTNLDYNLYDISHNSGEMTKMSFPQATYTYNGSVKDDDFWAAMTGDVGGSKKDDRLYDFNIYVYEEGSIADGLTSGSISADKLLVTLNGNMQ